MSDKPLKGVKIRKTEDGQPLGSAYNPRMVRKHVRKKKPKPRATYQRNDVDAILNFVAKNVVKNSQDEKLLHNINDFVKFHEDLDPGRVAVLSESFKIAMGEPEKEKRVKCKSCGEELRFRIPAADREKNKVAALKMLLDKLVPSLKQIDSKVMQSTFDTGKFCELIGPSIAKYVPLHNQEEAVEDIKRILLQCGYEPMRTDKNATQEYEPDYTISEVNDGDSDDTH